MHQDAPLSYFLHSHGPAAGPTQWLDWIFTSIVCLVCLIVAVLLVWALIRRRPADAGDIRSRQGEGLMWIYVGTGVSTAALIAMAIYAVMALNAVANPPTEPALTIRVTGYDWWWSADYPATDGSAFATANEIHIPTGQPVRVELKTADVIHAFWVPQLAGKTQMIPGTTNVQWLQADQPGIYRGQCTQFCGLQHAHMAFEVVAQSPSDFAAWRAHQAEPAAATSDPGQQIFIDNCGSCHAVRGTAAAGGHAPDLTHLMSRRQLGAGTLDNTPANLALWIAHPQKVKPGVNMADTVLPPADLVRLETYLGTLK